MCNAPIKFSPGEFQAGSIFWIGIILWNRSKQVKRDSRWYTWTTTKSGKKIIRKVSNGPQFFHRISEELIDGRNDVFRPFPYADAPNLVDVQASFQLFFNRVDLYLDDVPRSREKSYTVVCNPKRQRLPQHPVAHSFILTNCGGRSHINNNNSLGANQ